MCDPDFYQRYPFMLYVLAVSCVALFIVGWVLYGVGLQQDADLKMWHMQYVVTNCSQQITEVLISDFGQMLIMNATVPTSCTYRSGVPSTIIVGVPPSSGQDLKVASMITFIVFIIGTIACGRAYDEVDDCSFAC